MLLSNFKGLYMLGQGREQQTREGAVNMGEKDKESIELPEGSRSNSGGPKWSITVLETKLEGPASQH